MSGSGLPVKAEWHYSIAESEVDPKNTSHLALLNSQGMSLRKIEQRYGIPRSTLSWLLRKAEVRATRENRREKFSMMHVLFEDYLKNPKVSDPDKAIIKRWVNANRTQLQTTDTNFYSVRQERQYSLRQEDLNTLYQSQLCQDEM